jgi:hypothetical protein
VYFNTIILRVSLLRRFEDKPSWLDAVKILETSENSQQFTVFFWHCLELIKVEDGAVLTDMISKKFLKRIKKIKGVQTTVMVDADILTCDVCLVDSDRHIVLQSVVKPKPTKG